MSKYQNGKIYKIWNDEYSKCYIGSTCQSLSKRFSAHKSDYKYYIEGKKPVTSTFELFKHYGVENCKIELVENYPCNTKEELLAREGHYIRKDECLNKRVAGRDKKQRYVENKQYYYEKDKTYRINNPEKISEKKHRYWLKHRDRFLSKYECECGSVLSLCHKSKHLKTNKHQQYLQNQNNPHE